MQRANVFSEIDALIRERFEYSDTIGPDTVAADIPGWDSVAHIELIVAIEERFGIRLTTGETADVANVGALVGVVERHMARGRQ